MNDNKNTTQQNLYNATKAVPIEKFICSKTYIRKKKRCKNSDLNFYLTKLEKKVQMKTKASRGKETINIRAEINKIENKQQRKLTKSKDGCLKN